MSSSCGVITVRNEVAARFLHLSVSHSVHRGVSATPPRQTPPCPVHAGIHTPCPVHAGIYPPCAVHAGIWSTSGRSASYWNAYLYYVLKAYNHQKRDQDFHFEAK